MIIGTATLMPPQKNEAVRGQLGAVADEALWRDDFALFRRGSLLGSFAFRDWRG
jgi:hypothetical protein